MKPLVKTVRVALAEGSSLYHNLCTFRILGMAYDAFPAFADFVHFLDDMAPIVEDVADGNDVVIRVDVPENDDDDSEED